MKITRFACLALALTPLSLGLGTLIAPAPAFSAPVASNGGLPPGAPPLSAAQKEQQRAIRSKDLQTAQSIENNPQLSPQQKQQQIFALGTSEDAKMLALLTPKQRASVEAQRTTVMSLRQTFLKQHKQEFTERDQVAKALANSITSAQKARIKAYQDAANKQLLGLKNNTKMTDQEKANTAAAIERDAARDALTVFTPPQRALFNRYQALNVQITNELNAFAKANHTQ